MYLVPFKGTGKEYIGDDITEIQVSVKRVLQSCCQQLRAHLTKRNALRDVKERRSRLLKYVPDASRSIFGILEGMRKRKLEEEEGVGRIASPRKRVARASPTKRLKKIETSIMNNLSKGKLTEDTIKQHLLEAVEVTANAGIGDNEEADGGKSKSKKDDSDRESLYLVPLYDQPKGIQHVIQHPMFDFFPMNVTL